MSELRLVPCGDRALLCYLGDGIDPTVNDRVHALACAVRRAAHPAVVEVTPAFHTVMVEFDPVRIRPEQVEEIIRRAAGEVPDTSQPTRTVTIPVCYGGRMGPDLGQVAAHTGLTPTEVVKQHTGQPFRVYCLGFSPGFPYLGELDRTLWTPRLPEPRLKVPEGSVGIGGEQTGIYPVASPGGWQLIGRTPLRLFDPQRAEPMLLQPGDQVRFESISPAEYDRLDQEQPRPQMELPAYEPGRTGLRILQPGLMTTIQDLGRRGYMAYGVPVAGAADHLSLMVGNWLLGNRARTAALEITLTGPEIEFTGPTAFALTGAPIHAEWLPGDGGPARLVPGWTSFLASPGDRLRIGAVSAGCRAYLCIAGGLDLPPVLGSLSEDLFGKIGPLGRPLKAGDWLPIGLPLHPPADLAGRSLPADAIPDFGGSVIVRATLGPQDQFFTPDAQASLFREPYRVGAQSDRQGLRLEGARLAHADGSDMISEPIPPGSIQVPPNGLPILLLGNRQTSGGYPKIGVAIFTDIWSAAQLRQGDQIRFQQVDTAEAYAIAWQERRRLGQIRRHLEREFSRDRSKREPEALALAVAPDGAARLASSPSVGQPVGHGPVRTFRVAIAGIEFLCEVEEVKD